MVDNAEEAKRDPVGEPLLIVIGTLRFEGQERHEARVCDADQAGNVCVSNSEHDHDDASNQAIAGDLSWGKSSECSNLFHFCRVDFKQA